MDAQERLFREYCEDRCWDQVGIYREEGKSAHSDSISKRPVLRQLLEDAAHGKFDVVVVHTFDRWARNLKVLLETVAVLNQHGVGLVSITENLDWSTPEGRLVARTLGSFGEFFSDMLGTHVKKGISERAHQGRHLGAVPFGYQSCWENKQLVCEPEHPGGVHIDLREAEAVRELFRRYSSGLTTTTLLATWMNVQGFRTRNKHRPAHGNGNAIAEPRLFTNASVRVILHNVFYAGIVRHRDQALPGCHNPLVTEDLYQAVQTALKRNSGRSETLHPGPEREYLLKGLIRCAHCGLPMWAQTYANANRYYREQKGSRGTGYCVDRSGSMPCSIPDEQIGRVVGAIVLPEAWMDRVLARIHLADEVERIQQERQQTQQRLKRLGKAYVDGLYPDNDYRREKRALEEKLSTLVVPGIDSAKEAGKLLESLPTLWDQANLAERRMILLTMLDAIYVDTVEEKAIVAIRPKPAFQAFFEIATTRQGSDVVLINEPPEASNEPEAADLCFWWRRRRPRIQLTPATKWRFKHPKYINLDPQTTR